MNQEWNPPKTYVYGPRVVHDHHHDELPDYLSRLSLGGEPKTYPVKKFVLEQGSIDKVRLDKLKSLLLENLYEGEGQSGNLYKWDDLKTILEATDEELDSALFLLGIVKAAFVAIGCNALTSHTYKIGKGENLKKYLNRRLHNQQQQQNMINSGMYGDEDVFYPPVSSPNTERTLSRFKSGGGDNESQMMYQNLARYHESVSSSSSVTVDRLMATNLLRQSSSPAGFFEHKNVENGYSMMRSMEEFLPANGSVPDSSFSSTNRLKSPMAFSSGSHSSSRLQSHTKAGGYVASFPIGSWDESSMLTDGFMKELGETDQISSCENQNEVETHAPTGLAHQLSLPTSSTELSAMANLLQFQDNVPLRSRAKRGCATHPRSIAERVRRTRISERMRKLQDLVPNMDKQTSIADMLDLAVDYIKDLQKQVETHSDHHAKCTCPNKKKL